MGLIENKWVVVNPTMTKPRYFSGMDGDLPLMLPMGDDIRTYSRECDTNSDIQRINDACDWNCTAVYIDRLEYDDAAPDVPAAETPPPDKPPLWKPVCKRFGVQLWQIADGSKWLVTNDAGLWKSGAPLEIWGIYCDTVRAVGLKRLAARQNGGV